MMRRYVRITPYQKWFVTSAEDPYVVFYSVSAGTYLSIEISVIKVWAFPILYRHQFAPRIYYLCMSASITILCKLLKKCVRFSFDTGFDNLISLELNSCNPRLANLWGQAYGGWVAFALEYPHRTKTS